MRALRLSGMIALLAALSLQSLSGAAVAAEHVIEEMSVSVMPEYDDPRVLAVFQAKLADDVELPYTAEFLVPADAKDPEIGMACEVPEGGGHVCKPYQTTDKDGFRSVSYQATQAKNLFFEYYWDPFSEQAATANGQKSFKYEFKAPESVKTLMIGVQQPLKAEEFELTPAPDETVRDSEGMNVNTFTYSDVKKDQVITINASYVKTDPAVSKPRNNPSTLPVVAAGGQALTGGADQGPLRQEILLFAGVFLAAITAVFVWRFRPSPAPVIARPVAKAKAKDDRRTTAAGTKFCSSCGRPVASNVKFCSECGDAV